ncbi:MAG: hypothetical protein ACXVP0_06020, partial [Bacteroidia bacterium]
DQYLKYKLGICGVFMSDKHDEALTLLNEVYAVNKKAIDIDFYFALLYHKTFQFDKAIELANALNADPKTSPEQKTTLNQLVTYCKNGKILMQNPVNVKIENIGNPPNSESDEYSPVITSDEETMIFTYRGKESMGGLLDKFNKPSPDGDYNEDIFIARKVNGKWQKPEGIAELNTIENEAVISISNDGQLLFIFKEDDKDKGDIYESHLENGKFAPPVKLRGEVNSASWEGSISQSADQKRIFFSSERPGGKGGKDLYVAYKMADGSWGNVKNLGDKINTPYDEDAPFIHPDGRALIFSSQGHNSMGDFDIFLSDLDELDSTWKAPVNVGYPVNTPDYDLFYVLSADGKRGYYSSAKKDGIGGQDIFVAEPAITSKKSYVTIIKGRVTEMLAPYECDINVKTSDGRNYGTFRSNRENGGYLVNVPSGYNYKLTFYHPVLGDKTFDIVTEKVDGYGEKVINVGFGMNDTSATNHQTVVVETKKDDVAAATPTVAAPPRIGSEQELIDKYGALKIEGLKYFIQVAATRSPQKYNKAILKKICTVKQKGTIMSDIHLLVANKEFDLLKDASTFLKDVKGAGQTDAFITAEMNGQRYYLTDLIRMGVYTKAGK